MVEVHITSSTALLSEADMLFVHVFCHSWRYAIGSISLISSYTFKFLGFLSVTSDANRLLNRLSLVICEMLLVDVRSHFFTHMTFTIFFYYNKLYSLLY